MRLQHARAAATAPACNAGARPCTSSSSRRGRIKVLAVAAPLDALPRVRRRSTRAPTAPVPADAEAQVQQQQQESPPLPLRQQVPRTPQQLVQRVRRAQSRGGDDTVADGTGRWAAPGGGGGGAPAAAAAAAAATLGAPRGAAENGSSSNSSSSSSSGLRLAGGASQDWGAPPTGLAVTWLGTSSGAPTRDRNISCTLVRTPRALYMVDCGEGSARQARKTRLDVAAVEAIMITHLHGDHCFGLPGVLISICAARRRREAGGGDGGEGGAGGAVAVEQQQQQWQQQQRQKQLDPEQQRLAAAAAALLPPAPPSDDGGPGALRVVGPPRLAELLRAQMGGTGAWREVDRPVFVTELAERPGDAHGWQAMEGAPPGAAYVRRLAAERLPRGAAPPGLHARLGHATLEWQRFARRGGGYDGAGSVFEAQVGLVWRLPFSEVLVSAAQLQHRVPCWGYVFDELPQVAAGEGGASGFGGSSSSSMESSRDDDGDVSGGDDDVGSSSSSAAHRDDHHCPAPRRVVLLGDTVDSRAIAPLALGADLVSHEATFAAGMEHKAAAAQHSTARMAGEFAAAVGARALMLTHFSARYEGSAGDAPLRGGGGGRGGRFNGGGRNGGGGDRRVRAWEAAEAEAAAAAAERRAIEALQREAAGAFRGAGRSGRNVLLASDLLTVHVAPRARQE